MLWIFQVSHYRSVRRFQVCSLILFLLFVYLIRPSRYKINRWPCTILWIFYYGASKRFDGWNHKKKLIVYSFQFKILNRETEYEVELGTANTNFLGSTPWLVTFCPNEHSHSCVKWPIYRPEISLTIDR